MQSCVLWAGRRGIRALPTEWKRASCRVMRSLFLARLINTGLRARWDAAVAKPETVFNGFDQASKPLKRLKVSDGVKSPVLRPVLMKVPFLACSRGVCDRQLSGAIIFLSFAEQLANHLFHRHLLDVNVANVAGLEESPAGFRHFCAWDFELHRNRRLFGYLTEAREIPCCLFFKSKTQNLIA